MAWLWAIVKGVAGAWLSRNGERYARAAVTVAARRARAYAVRRLGEGVAADADALIRRVSGGPAPAEVERLMATAKGITDRLDALARLYGDEPPDNVLSVQEALVDQLNEITAQIEAAK